MTTRPTHLLLCLVAAAASLFPLLEASAQERAASAPSSASSSPSSSASDSLPFRRGQWGAEFAIADGVTGVGAMRFRSPRSAWLVDGSFGVFSRHLENVGSGTTSDDDLGTIQLRAGPRRYAPLARGAAAYIGGGLLGGYSWSRPDDPDLGRTSSWQSGLFADVGAMYLVSSRLSLGAQISLVATYGRLTRHGTDLVGELRDRRFGIATTPVRLLGALYF